MHNSRTFGKMKKQGEKIVMVTAYDYPSGKYAQQGEVDAILVGDSLGMVVLGYQNTLSVTVDDIIHHSKAVRRGADSTFVIADMPYMSFHFNNEETKRNAGRIIVEAGVNAVKLEGGKPNRIEAIKAIVDCEIPVVGHLGLTPQSINSFGGYVVQGKNEAQFSEIIRQAELIQQAGAFMLVLEAIPEKLGKEITAMLDIPTIGIGAGRFTDGQVLVYHDILGMADLKPKFVKQYASLGQDISGYIKNYTREVKSRLFPDKEHVYIPLEEDN
ncbi:MAG: 3-methyl-2-oxobutanoate hydroxymethyltransferase [Candidatus Cloacimonas sp. SDB]|nr:MAG: 3-methyl-2-oxobutanoate hydroxymethyltransferase [Candidatus Cloacimonas sp. SDB]